MAKFELYVDDNFNHVRDDESGPEKTFDTYEKAVTAAKQIIDGFLTEVDYKGMTADELLSGWTHYGESPYIVSDDKEYIKALKVQGECTLAEIQRRMEVYGEFNLTEIFKPIEVPGHKHFSASDYVRQRCGELCPKG